MEKISIPRSRKTDGLRSVVRKIRNKMKGKHYKGEKLDVMRLGEITKVEIVEFFNDGMTLMRTKDNDHFVMKLRNEHE